MRKGKCQFKTQQENLLLKWLSSVILLQKVFMISKEPWAIYDTQWEAKNNLLKRYFGEKKNLRLLTF